MEFNIRKKATLPYLEVDLHKSGRLDYNLKNTNLSGSTIFLYMKNVETGVYKIAKGVCVYSQQNNSIYYQFTKKNSSEAGRFEVEFKVSNNQGEIILPLTEKLFVNVLDSFSNGDFCCGKNKNETAIITPTPVIPTPTPVTPTPTPTPTPINDNVTFWSSYNGIPPYDNSTVVSFNTIANATDAENLICSFFPGGPYFYGFYINTSTPIGLGFQVPYGGSGNFIVSYNGTSPSYLNYNTYWVVTDNNGYVIEYTLLNYPC
jgi:hypothetical protein